MRPVSHQAIFLHLLLLPLILGPLGCKETEETSPELTTPTINEVYPRTNNHEIEISGTRSPGTIVWLQLRAAPTPIALTGSRKLSTWSATVLLNEGYNSFVLFASDADQINFSAPSPQVEVEVDTTPPECPTVINAPSSIDLSTTESLVYTLEGTKGADGNLIINGVEEIPRNGETTWTFPLTILRGENSITLSSVDDLENVTTPTDCPSWSSLTIVGTEIPAPTFADLPWGTNDQNLSLTGTKPSGTLLYLTRSFQNEVESQSAEVLVSEDPEATTWTFSELQWSQGLYELSIHATEPETNFQSTIITETLLVDSIAPSPPVLNSLTSPISNNAVLLSGTKDPDSEICVQINQSPTCATVIPFEPASTFSEEVPLELGSHTLHLIARDTVQNESAPVEISITRLPLPEINFLTPTENGIITTNTLEALVSVEGGTVIGSEIDTVELCLNDSCLAASPAEGTTASFASTFDLSSFETGTLHSLTCNATNTGGIENSQTIEVLLNPGLFLLSANDVEAPRVSSVSTPDGNLHVVWEGRCEESTSCPDGTPSDSRDILYRRFSPFGGGWSTIELVSTADAASPTEGTSQAPVLALGTNSQILVLWQDNGDLDQDNTPDYDLYQRQLTLSTETWGPVTALAPSPHNDTQPSLSSDPSGHFHLTWVREEEVDNRNIYYSKYTGDAWSSPLLLSDHENDGDSHSPTLQVDSSSTAHIAWVDHGDLEYVQNQIPKQTQNDSDILYRRVRDNQILDPQYIHVSGDYSHDDTTCADCEPRSEEPSIAINSDDQVYIVWVDTAPHGQMESDGLASTDPDIYLRRFKNGSSLDIPPTGLVNIHPVDSGDSQMVSSSPFVVVNSSDQALILWTETDESGQSHLAFSQEYLASDAGVWFTPLVNLTSPDTGPIRSTLSRDVFDNIHAVWSQETLLDPSLNTIVFPDGAPDSPSTQTAILYSLVETSE